MNPWNSRALFGVRPLPERAAQLLHQVAAPPRLVAHHILVHEVALGIVERLYQQWPALALNHDSLTFGAAIHDIGKVIHQRELQEPGQAHEPAGRDVLIH